MVLETVQGACWINSSHCSLCCEGWCFGVWLSPGQEEQSLEWEGGTRGGQGSECLVVALVGPWLLSSLLAPSSLFMFTSALCVSVNI